MTDYNNDSNNSIRSQIPEHLSEHNQMSANQNRNSGCFGPGIVLTGCGTMIGAPLLIIAMVLITGLNTLSGIWDSFTGIFTPRPTTAQVESSATIVQSVQPLGQFVSVSAQLAKANIRVEVTEGIQNACGRTAFHVAQGAVEAGIDLTQFTEDDVIFNTSSNEIMVTLPKPQLTSCRIEYLDQYQRSTSACGPRWDTIQRLARTVALEEFRDDAIEGGILERARREAEMSLGSVIEALTNREVTIEFKDPVSSDEMFPSSCQAIPPDNWRYNDEKSVWEAIG